MKKKAINKKQINTYMRKLDELQEKIEDVMGKLKKELNPYFDFEINITHLGGDGFAILDIDGNVVKISECVKEIEKEGRINKDEYMTLGF